MIAIGFGAGLVVRDPYPRALRLPSSAGAKKPKAKKPKASDPAAGAEDRQESGPADRSA
ncbi:hypothetical protein ACFWWM_23550 [Streptomyces sp. NPDC058682]|uniref:hypothetical protein n=1 Tax=Streptomyces sp. NPDC058682 TaxID=3346596 RepID=UPI00365FD1F7